MTPTTLIMLSRTNENFQDAYVSKSLIGTHHTACTLLEAFADLLKGDGFPEISVQEAINELHEAHGTQDESEPTLPQPIAPYWRLLNDGEVIEDGDEIWSALDGWRNAADDVGRFFASPVRRLVS